MDEKRNTLLLQFIKELKSEMERQRGGKKKVKQENVMSPIKSIYLTITFVCKKAVKREEKALIIHCNGRRDC